MTLRIILIIIRLIFVYPGKIKGMTAIFKRSKQIREPVKDKIIYICLLMLLSTSCNEQTFQPYDIILECYDSKYQKEGYDIKTIIEDYEKLLVEEGILKDDSGKSYLEMMRKINSDKDFRIKASTFMEYDPFFKVANETKLAIFECENEMIELPYSTILP